MHILHLVRFPLCENGFTQLKVTEVMGRRSQPRPHETLSVSASSWNSSTAMTTGLGQPPENDRPRGREPGHFS